MARLRLRARKQYSNEEIQDLANRLRKGEDVTIDLIEAHYPLVEKFAGYFSQIYPFRKDDIKCEACFALVRGVDSAKEVLEDGNITAYLAVKIKGAIKDFCSRDSLIPIPRYLFKQMQEEECITDFAARQPTHEGLIETHGAGVLKNAAIIVPLNTDYYNLDIPVFTDTTDMTDLYEKMKLTELETTVCNFRLDGYTLEEIGSKIGATKQYIYLIIQNIKSKITALGFKTVNHVPLNPGKKTCSRCNIERSLTFFYKIGEDSYKSICKICMKGARDAKASCNSGITVQG